MHRRLSHWSSTKGYCGGGIAASGVVHAVLGYPEWYDPIQENGPPDCISRINNIIDKFDHLVETNNTEAIQQFKEIFGLGSLTDLRDFAMTVRQIHIALA